MSHFAVWPILGEPMSKFIPQFAPQVRPKDIEAVQKQMQSGWVGCGEKTLQFEEKLRQITGAKHCISTTSGTTALFLAVHSLGLSHNSSILFPAYTFLAGANAIRMANKNVVLCDIDPDTMCMYDTGIHDFPARPLFSSIMFVNHNGYCGPIRGAFRKYCDDAHIPMIEDSSQALGIPSAGRLGDIGVFSFSVPKLITTGQGGAIITDNHRLASRCLELRDHGDNNWRKTRIHEKIGGNFKFNDILAAYGLSQLEDMDELLAQRKFIFDCYREHIELIDYGYDSTWMAIYKSDKADKIIEVLSKNNISAVKYYKPVNINPPFQGRSYPHAKKIAEQVVYLPSSLSLSKDEIDKVCRIINGVERK